VRGTIFNQDLFSPQSNQIESYDVVFSMGVVEHFPDTLKVLEAVSAYLRPGGVMVTIIPNYTGWLGKMKGWLNRESLERHELLTKEELQEMHQAGGFQTRYCGYHIFFDPNCLHPGPQWPAGLQRLFLRLRRLPEILVGLVWLTLPTVRLNRQTASCIVFLGERELGKSRASGQ
jgi:SAM-dependent methyltransferase